MPRVAERNETDAGVVELAVRSFLEKARKPALIEPGEMPILIGVDNTLVEVRAGRLTIQAWDETRNLVRKVLNIAKSERGKLTLSVHRFAGKPGELHLVDLLHPRTDHWEKRGSRMVFRERLRRMLNREFPSWRIAELSSEQDLVHSLSPAFARALLTKGTQAIAAIAAPPEAEDFSALLTFGLIWLDYARQRDEKRQIGSLVFWAPGSVVSQVSYFLPWLDADRVKSALYVYSDEDHAAVVDPSDYGNVLTQLEPLRRPDEAPEQIEHADVIALQDGSLSLRVAGLEFARYAAGKLTSDRRPVTWSEAGQTARALHGMRNHAAEPKALIYKQNPEAWLEKQVRDHLVPLEASLSPAPIYGQVPAIAGQSRTVLDLLAIDYTGRLAVIELKASQDIQLPVQALDYWLRVRLHLFQNEFSRYGYFPGRQIRIVEPRLILISPALDFHPSTETVLSFFRPEIEVTRLGLSADWRSQPRIMFRLNGAEKPHLP